MGNNNNNDNNKNNNNQKDNNKNDNEDNGKDGDNDNKNNDKGNGNNDDNYGKNNNKNNNKSNNNSNAYYEGNNANVGYYEEVNGYAVENFDGYEISTVNPGLSLLFYTSCICFLAFVIFGIITWRYKLSISGSLQKHMAHLANTIYAGKDKEEKEESTSIKNGDIELSRVNEKKSQRKVAMKSQNGKVSSERNVKVVTRIGRNGKKIYSIVPTMIECEESNVTADIEKRYHHYVGLKQYPQDRSSSAPAEGKEPNAVRPSLSPTSSDLSIDTAPASSQNVWYSLFANKGETASVLSEPARMGAIPRADRSSSNSSSIALSELKPKTRSNAASSSVMGICPNPEDNEREHDASISNNESLSFSDFSPSSLFHSLMSIHSNHTSDSVNSRRSVTPITKSKKKELSEGLIKDEVETIGREPNDNSVQSGGSSIESTGEFNINSELKEIINLAGP